jgi:hypothetical protein
MERVYAKQNPSYESQLQDREDYDEVKSSGIQ